MAKATDIINKALSYVGTKESPKGSNNVIFNTHYYGKPVSGSAYAWCCAYVWDIFRMCNASKLFYDGDKTAYCPNLQTWAKKRELVVDKTTGQAGDIVLFDWNGNNLADHVGFIVSKNSNGTYTTVEGNTSIASNDNGGNVMRRTRKLSEILMIIRPKYEQEQPKQTQKGEVKMYTYKNKTGKILPVYADTKLSTKIGTLNKDSTCKSFGLWENRVVLLYKVTSTGAYKIGFTDKTEGLS